MLDGPPRGTHKAVQPGQKVTLSPDGKNRNSFLREKVVQLENLLSRSSVRRSARILGGRLFFLYDHRRRHSSGPGRIGEYEAGLSQCTPGILLELIRPPLSSPYSEDLDQAVEEGIRRNFNPSTYISGKSRVRDGRYVFEVSESYTELIEDSREDVPPTLLAKSIGGAFTVDVIEERGGFAIVLPTFDTIAESIRMRLNEGPARSETALTETAHRRFIEIPMVNLALSPIAQILEMVDRDGSVRPEAVYHRKGPKKSQQYLDFLAQIDYLKRENGHYVPGDRLRGYSPELEEEKYDALLAGVLESGFEYLQSYFHLTQLTPYIRISNSYYYPSGEYGDRLRMKEELLRLYEKRIYRKARSLPQLRGQVSHMRKAEIFGLESNLVVGEETLFRDYCTTLRKSCQTVF